jgi:hypothetical protein
MHNKIDTIYNEVIIMFKHNIKIGDKIIFTNASELSMEVSTVKRISKVTFVTDNGQTLCLASYENFGGNFDNIVYFYKSWVLDRPQCHCEVNNGAKFFPEHAYIYSDLRHDSIAQHITSELKEKAVKEALIADRKAITAEFNQYFNELSAELTTKLVKKFVSTVCANCKHLRDNGTCDRDNSFYNIGVLSESKVQLWDGTLCSFEKKQGKES